MPLRLLTFLTVFLGILSILLTGVLVPPQPSIIIGVLLVGFFFWDTRLHTRVYLLAWYVITVLFLGWVIYDFGLNPKSEEDLVSYVPVAAMQLSIFILIFKVYNAKTDRDYMQMFLLSFFMFVSCAGVSVEFYLLPLLLVYMIVATWALTLFHLRRHLQSPEAAVAAPVVALTGRPKSARLLRPSFFTGTLLVSLLVAGVAALLFVFFPRSAASDNPLNFQGFLGGFSRTLVTGSSGLVELDLAGIISRDPTMVMRVEFPSLEVPPANALWRRGALHQYDNRSRRWLRPIGRFSTRDRGPRGRGQRLVNALIQKSPTLFVADSELDKYNSIEDLRNDPRLVEQRYTLLLGYPRLPIFSFAGSPVAVVGDLSRLSCDVDESFSCEARYGWWFSYTVFSRLHPAQGERAVLSGPAEPTSDRFYEVIKRFHTQLPYDLSPRFTSLANQVAEGAATDFDKAWAIRNYLALNCRYSLNLTAKASPKGRLYDFLFSNKPGHCEFFASAMVLLLRELGIPCRLAYGYSSGEWNPDRRAFEVRQLDAHVWPEVFIKNRGWVAFDPTPALPDEETPQTLFSILLQPITGLVREFEKQWVERVIEYTRFRQRAVVRSVREAIRNVSESIGEYAFSVKLAFSNLWRRISEDMFLRLFVPVATVSFLLALAVAGTIRIHRRGKFHRIYTKNQLSRGSRRRVRFYEKMLHLLMDKGIAKKVEDTPLEFAESIVSASRFFSGVKTLTELYYFVRFGDGKLTADQSRAIQSILQRLTYLVPPRKATEQTAEPSA